MSEKILNQSYQKPPVPSINPQFTRLPQDQNYRDQERIYQEVGQYYSREWAKYLNELQPYIMGTKSIVLKGPVNAKKSYSGGDVYAIQECLKELGYLTADNAKLERGKYYNTGFYGAHTANAVVSFKRAVNEKIGYESFRVNNSFDQATCFQLLQELSGKREIALMIQSVMNQDNNSFEFRNNNNFVSGVNTVSLSFNDKGKLQVKFNSHEANQLPFELFTGKTIQEIFNELNEGPQKFFSKTWEVGNRNGKKKVVELIRLKDKLWLQPEAAEDFIKLNSKFKERFGFNLLVDVSFRPGERQEYLRELWLRKEGAPAKRPGESEHEIGLAVDFIGCGPLGSPNEFGKWLMENAKDFNFHPKLPQRRKNWHKYEPWHFEWRRQ